MNTYDIGGYEIAVGQNQTERLPKWEVKFFVAICVLITASLFHEINNVRVNMCVSHHGIQ
jgi:hypothetical protein